MAFVPLDSVTPATDAPSDAHVPVNVTPVNGKVSAAVPVMGLVWAVRSELGRDRPRGRWRPGWVAPVVLSQF